MNFEIFVSMSKINKTIDVIDVIKFLLLLLTKYSSLNCFTVKYVKMRHITPYPFVILTQLNLWNKIMLIFLLLG